VEDVKQKSIYAMRWKVVFEKREDMYFIRTKDNNYVESDITVTLARHIVRLHNASLKAKE
jgi:hypothetical protein